MDAVAHRDGNSVLLALLHADADSVDVSNVVSVPLTLTDGLSLGLADAELESVTEGVWAATPAHKHASTAAASPARPCRRWCSSPGMRAETGRAPDNGEPLLPIKSAASNKTRSARNEPNEEETCATAAGAAVGTDATPRASRWSPATFCQQETPPRNQAAPSSRERKVAQFEGCKVEDAATRPSASHATAHGACVV